MALLRVGVTVAAYVLLLDDPPPPVVEEAFVGEDPFAEDPLADLGGELFPDSDELEVGDGPFDERDAYEPTLEEGELTPLTDEEGEPELAAEREPRGIWIGGAPRGEEHDEEAPIDDARETSAISIPGANDDSLGEDVPARIARLQELLANREQSPSDVVLELEDDGPITLDEDALGLEAAVDEEPAPEPELQLPWHVTARAAAEAVLGLVLSIFLLLLGRLERDPRVGIAGGLIGVSVAMAAIELASWVTGAELWSLGVMGAPLVLVAFGLVASTARRWRALAFGLLVLGESVRLVSRERLVDMALDLEISGRVIGHALVALFAVGWCVVAVVFVGHARAHREADASMTAGPYRTAASGGRSEAVDGWAPDAVLRVASVWLLAMGALRIALAMDLLLPPFYAMYAFAAGVALAIAATLAARRARARDARRAFAIAAAFLYVSSLVSLGYSVYRSAHGFGLVFFEFVQLDSLLLVLLVTACFVGAVGAVIAAVRLEARAAARPSPAPPPPRLTQITVMLSSCGAASVPWLAHSNAPWMACGAWPLLVVAVLVGAFALRRDLLRIARWQEEQVAEEEQRVEPAAG